MIRRGLLVVPFIALGIALAFLLYTVLEKQAAPEENLLSFLPSKILNESGGVFYTNYSLLKTLTQTTSTPTSPEQGFLEFSQKINQFDLGTSLFQVFRLPDFARELSLDWSSLQEVAWTPYSPVEVVRGTFDWQPLLERLEKDGFKKREVGKALLLDGVLDPASALSAFGQVARVEDILIMEHFSTLKEYPVTRETVLESIEGTSQALTQTEAWKDYSPFLKDAPSFFLGPAPDLPNLEEVVSLDPALTEDNYSRIASQRAECLLSGGFLDFCAFSDLKEPGKVVFLLRYKSEQGAQEDAGKIKTAMERSYSSVFRGENFITLFGEPLVSREGKFLRVEVHSRTGIKIVQAMVQDSDFGFLFKLTQE